MLTKSHLSGLLICRHLRCSSKMDQWTLKKASGGVNREKLTELVSVSLLHIICRTFDFCRFDAREASSSDKNLRRIERFERYGVSEANGTLLFVSANNSFMAQFFKPGGHCDNGGSCANMNFSTPDRVDIPACNNRQSVEEWSHMRENGASW